MFQKVVHKGGESEINYNKIFHNSKALEISVGNSYPGDKLMHTLLDNFQCRECRDDMAAVLMAGHTKTQYGRAEEERWSCTT